MFALKLLLGKAQRNIMTGVCVQTVTTFDISDDDTVRNGYLLFFEVA